jgi:hypothetical protein
MKRRRSSSTKEKEIKNPEPPCVLDHIMADHWTCLFQEHLNPADYIAMVHAWPPLLLAAPFLQKTYGPKNRSDMVQFLYRYGSVKQIRLFWSKGARTTDYDQWVGFFASDRCQQYFPKDDIAGEMEKNREPFMNDLHLRTGQHHYWRYNTRHALIRNLLQTRNKSLIEWCQIRNLFSYDDLGHPQCIQSYFQSVIRPTFNRPILHIAFDLRDYMANPEECLRYYQKNPCRFGIDNEYPEYYISYDELTDTHSLRLYDHKRRPSVCRQLPIVWPAMPDFTQFPMTHSPQWIQ